MRSRKLHTNLKQQTQWSSRSVGFVGNLEASEICKDLGSKLGNPMLADSNEPFITHPEEVGR